MINITSQCKMKLFTFKFTFQQFKKFTDKQVVVVPKIIVDDDMFQAASKQAVIITTDLRLDGY